MKRNTRILVSLLMTGLLTAAPLLQAADQTGTYMTEPSTATPFVQAGHAESYGETVGRKALSGLANIGTSFLELPKNIININNQSNFAFGFAGGSIQGLFNWIGRTVIGVTDLVLAPLPTQPVVYPLYVWQNFETNTSYGPIFRLCTPSEDPCLH